MERKRICTLPCEEPMVPGLNPGALALELIPGIMNTDRGSHRTRSTCFSTAAPAGIQGSTQGTSTGLNSRNICQNPIDSRKDIICGFLNNIRRSIRSRWAFLIDHDLLLIIVKGGSEPPHILFDPSYSTVLRAGSGHISPLSSHSTSFRVN